MLRLKAGKVPALVDTGAQFSCVLSDVAEFLYLTGEPCVFSPCSVCCVLADGTRGEVTNAVRLHVKLLDFAWDYEFKVLNGGPSPIILGLDFLRRTSMIVDVADKKFSFGFAPHCVGEFGALSEEVGGDTYLHGLSAEVSGAVSGQTGWAGTLIVESFSREFPALFSSTLGTAKCAPYDIELLDSVPVWSSPYRCAPPKTAKFRDMVNELLQQGVVRPSKSPYASPAFLVPKRDGGFRLVDYRKVNSKVVFDSYPMPTIEQALDQFGGAVVFSVLDLNSAYYQIPLSEKSRRITAFYTPFGLFEFNKLPMGISVGCQGLSRVVDEFFADLKGSFVFNFVDDLVVYSPSIEEHRIHVRKVLNRLQGAGLTLNPEKVLFGATEIKYLGLLISGRGVKIVPDRVLAVQQYPRPTSLRSLRRFMGMVGFYARFIPWYGDITIVLHGLKKKGLAFAWKEQHQEALEALKRALC